MKQAANDRFGTPKVPDLMWRRRQNVLLQIAEKAYGHQIAAAIREAIRIAMQQEEWRTYGKLSAFLKTAGLDVSPATLHRWTGHITSTSLGTIAVLLGYLGMRLDQFLSEEALSTAVIVACLSDLSRTRLGLRASAVPLFSESEIGALRELANTLRATISQLSHEEAWAHWQATNRDAVEAWLRGAGAAHPFASFSVCRNIGDLLVCVGDWMVIRKSLPRHLLTLPDVFVDVIPLPRRRAKQHSERQTEMNGAATDEVLRLIHESAKMLKERSLLIEAEQLRRTAVSLAKENGKIDARYALALDSLGHVLVLLGAFDEAERLLQEALQVRRHVLGRKHVEVGMSLHNLGHLYLRTGRLDAADKVLREALNIRTRASNDVAGCALTKNLLGEVSRRQGRGEDADAWYAEALEDLERGCGKDHPDVAMVLNNQGLRCDEKGHTAQARDKYTQALAIYRRHYGNFHLDVATVLNNLAEAYRVEERYTQAEPLLQESLEIAEHNVGKQHSDVATVLNNLGLLCHDRRQFAAAKKYHERALRIRRKALNPQHSDIGQSLYNLASLCESQRLFADAENLYRQALAIWEAALPENHSWIADARERALYVRGRQGKDPKFRTGD